MEDKNYTFSLFDIVTKETTSISTQNVYKDNPIALHQMTISTETFLSSDQPITFPKKRSKGRNSNLFQDRWQNRWQRGRAREANAVAAIINTDDEAITRSAQAERIQRSVLCSTGQSSCTGQCFTSQGKTYCDSKMPRTRVAAAPRK